jgi:hypothetical protein
MPDTAEKIHEVDLEHEAIERWLREDVVKIYDAVKAGRSTGKPLEQARADGLKRLVALDLTKADGFTKTEGSAKKS